MPLPPEAPWSWCTSCDQVPSAAIRSSLQWRTCRRLRLAVSSVATKWMGKRFWSRASSWMRNHWRVGSVLLGDRLPSRCRLPPLTLPSPDPRPLHPGGPVPLSPVRLNLLSRRIPGTPPESSPGSSGRWRFPILLLRRRIRRLPRRRHPSLHPGIHRPLLLPLRRSLRIRLRWSRRLLLRNPGPRMGTPAMMVPVNSHGCSRQSSLLRRGTRTRPQRVRRQSPPHPLGTTGPRR